MDPLSVFNPAAGTRGKAVILQNNAPSPLAVLQQQQAQQRQQALMNQRLQHEEEQAAAKRLNEMMPDTAPTWAHDLEEGKKLSDDLHTFVADMSERGVDLSNPVKYPREWHEFQKMKATVLDYVHTSKTQKAAYEDYISNLQKNPDKYNSLASLKTSEAYKNASVKDRAQMQLNHKRNLNPTFLSANAVKNLKLEPDTTMKVTARRNGMMTTEEIKTYSPESLATLAASLQNDPDFNELVQDSYDNMDAEDQINAGGLKGLLKSSAEKQAQLHQNQQIKQDYAIDLEQKYLQGERHHRDSMRMEQQRIDISKANAEKEKTTDKTTQTVDNRIDLIDAMGTGDQAAIRGLFGATAAGKRVKSAKIINKNGKGVIELQINSDTKETKGGVPSMEAEAPSVIEIEMSKPNWQTEVSNILNTLAPGKDMIQPEDLRKRVEERNKWGLGANGEQDNGQIKSKKDLKTQVLTDFGL